MQSGFQAFLQISKAKSPLLALEQTQALGHTARGMLPHPRGRAGQLLQEAGQVRKGLKHFHLAGAHAGRHTGHQTIFAGLGQALQRHARPACRQMGHARFVTPLGPSLQGVQPPVEATDDKSSAVPAFGAGRVLRQHKAAHQRHPFAPQRLQRLQLLALCGFAQRQHLCE